MHPWIKRPLVRVIRGATAAVRWLTGVIDSITPAAPAEETMLDGSPVTVGHREIDSSGMQLDYVVLSEAEREKGYVRPVRAAYVHEVCAAVTTMAVPIAETYARDPKFYGETFCAQCLEHFPVAQFKWCGTDERVGS